MANSKLINKDALLAEIERLDEFYHASKSAEGTAILDSLRSFIDKSEVKTEEFEYPNININDAVEVSSRMKYIDDELKPIASDRECKNYLQGYWLALVKPPVAVSTKEAYSNIKPRKPKKCCRDIVLKPIETWKEELVNDFEEGVFSLHPELADIKQALYDKGAVYACMSGSGSSIFGIFKEKPEGISEMFADSKTYVMEL